MGIGYKVVGDKGIEDKEVRDKGIEGKGPHLPIIITVLS